MAEGEEGTTEAGSKERTGTSEGRKDRDEETLEKRSGKSFQEVCRHFQLFYFLVFLLIPLDAGCSDALV